MGPALRSLAFARFSYVGPAEVKARWRGAPAGVVIASVADARAYGDLLSTFVVDLQGCLRLADRHSEHVACAGFADVLAAGEIEIHVAGTDAEVVFASNLSTGYCPAIASWSALALALEGAGIAHGGGFTHAFEFRQCPACSERQVVKDEHWFCELCGAVLPRHWNFASGATMAG